MAYEAVIGLECHIQVRTRSKMFCDCPVEFGSEPNSNVCPVCLGLPGALPRANAAAVDAAIRLGLALGCDVRQASVFARKNYFYPDMPKNYQITQYEAPLCVGGALPVALDGGMREFPLIRVHVEEDTGKSFHPERRGDRRVSRVDFNRAGIPLLELVSQPAFRDPGECAAFLLALRRLVRWLGVSDGDMEKGQLRCDANVSLRPAAEAGLGVKTELKNLNSVRGVERGLMSEIARQRGILEGGGRVEQATLLYDADRAAVAVMRTKEHAHDYRYFPEPDLPVLRVSDAWLAEARARLPELPWARTGRIATQYGIPGYDAGVLAEHREVADYFEEVVRCGGAAKLTSNWVMREILGLMKARGLTAGEWAGRVTAARLAVLLRHVAAASVTAAGAREVLAEMLERGGEPDAIIRGRGLGVTASADELGPVVRRVVEEHPGPVRQYLGGRVATLEFLVGQVMKRSGGRAAPQVVREMLEAELARRAREP